MKQRGTMFLALLLVATTLYSQTIPFETPPDEIDSVIALLDAVVIAEEQILQGADLTASDLEAVGTLIQTADILGAEDLAARTRALLLLAQDEPVALEQQPGLIEPLTPAPENLFRRETPAFDTWIGALSATGGMSLALSGIFYGLAERDFQNWNTEPDPAAASELFQAWRGYEILSLTLGGVAIGALGIGIPLMYGLSAPAQPAGLPLGQPTYTDEEREEALQALYAERARIVTAINRLPEVQSARSMWSTVGLTVGAVAGIASITSFYLAGESWDQYIEAPFTAEAEALGARVLVLDIIALSTAGLSVAGFGTTLGIEMLTEDRGELELELRAVNRQIITLRHTRAY